MPARIVHPNRMSRLDIELDLMPTDRIFQRWARSIGQDIGRERWAEPHTQATPLPDDAAIAVDQYVCSRGEVEKPFLHAWYRGQDPSGVLAQRFGMTQDEVYLYWRSRLWEAKPRFLAMPEVATLMQRHQQLLAHDFDNGYAQVCNIA